jgi:hypothetical protein
LREYSSRYSIQVQAAPILGGTLTETVALSLSPLSQSPSPFLSTCAPAIRAGLGIAPHQPGATSVPYAATISR